MRLAVVRKTIRTGEGVMVTFSLSTDFCIWSGASVGSVGRYLWKEFELPDEDGVHTFVLADATNVKYVAYPPFLSATLSKFGAISLIGGLGLGLFSTLAGGCPLRQHIMAGQGRVDSTVYLAGFYLGIIIYYLFVVKLLARVI